LVLAPRGFGYYEVMRTSILCVIPVVASILLCTTVLAQQNIGGPVYRFDPALIVENPRQPTLSADPQGVVVEKEEDETNVHLRTESTISPYLDAERGPELSIEELRLLPMSEDVDGASDYKLEAGIGLYVEDKARLNLGYRLQNQSSLLDDSSSDPFSLSGDLRVTFDVKVPFD
jgi:hypothetical protein